MFGDVSPAGTLSRAAVTMFSTCHTPASAALHAALPARSGRYRGASLPPSHSAPGPLTPPAAAPCVARAHTAGCVARQQLRRRGDALCGARSGRGGQGRAAGGRAQALVVVSAKTSMEFIKGTSESCVPDVKLTRARDGSSGTAVFFFEAPDVFEAGVAEQAGGDITGLYLVDEEGTLSTVDVSAKIVNGKPKGIEARYTMRSAFEWDRFMRFMERYAEDHGAWAPGVGGTPCGGKGDTRVGAHARRGVGPNSRQAHTSACGHTASARGAASRTHASRTHLTHVIHTACPAHRPGLLQERLGVAACVAARGQTSSQAGAGVVALSVA